MKNINKVLKASKCLGCGLCVSVCPVKIISSEYNSSEGFCFPKIHEGCVECGKCLSFCPAVSQGYSSDWIGLAKDIFLAHSNQDAVREGSTSGGLVNETVRFLLSKDVVEAVLLVRADRNMQSCIEAESAIVTKNNSLDMLQKPREFASRYVLVPLLKDLWRLIRQYKRIAIVGTPCQIRAARNYISKINKPVFCVYLGIACSSGISYKATKQYKKLMNAENAKIYYRGKGWPGQNTLVSGEFVKSFDHTKSLFERMFSSQLFKNKGCYECHDHFAESADISFCDLWTEEEIKNERVGKTCVIVRTEIGFDTIKNMEEGKQISIVRKVDKDELINSQMAVLIQKKLSDCLDNKYKVLRRITRLFNRTQIYRLFNYRQYDFMARAFSHVVWKAYYKYKKTSNGNCMH